MDIEKKEGKGKEENGKNKQTQQRHMLNIDNKERRENNKKYRYEIETKASYFQY